MWRLVFHHCVLIFFPPILSRASTDLLCVLHRFTRVYFKWPPPSFYLSLLFDVHVQWICQVVPTFHFLPFSHQLLPIALFLPSRYIFDHFDCQPENLSPPPWLLHIICWFVSSLLRSFSSFPFQFVFLILILFSSHFEFGSLNCDHLINFLSFFLPTEGFLCASFHSCLLPGCHRVSSLMTRKKASFFVCFSNRSNCHLLFCFWFCDEIVLLSSFLL